MARVVVCGYMIRHPFAGNVLAYFQYVLGLLRLGHDVLYLEESGWPDSCFDPATRTLSNDPAHGLAALRSLMSGLAVDFPVCYVDRDSGRVEGVTWSEARRMLGEAHLLLNVGGVCWLPEFRACRRRALIDMDPLFTQVGRVGLEGLDEYDVYFSYGANIGLAGCTIPQMGVRWSPTVPPVVPEIWRAHEPGQEAASHRGALTTIANWTAYGAIMHEGEYYGQKDSEFLELLSLPSLVDQRLELALAGAQPETVARLRTAGWDVRDAFEVSREVPVYKRYIASSRGEFSVAKHAYVKTHSGWFSDRSVCYLASGLPVILQDSGFSQWLPVGRGVLAFESLEGAAHCIEQVNAHYHLHCRAAREIAERTFSYREVLPRILDVALGTRAASPLR